MSKKKPMLILLGGFSCSGKGNLVSAIKEEAKKQGKTFSSFATGGFAISEKDNDRGEEITIGYQRMEGALKGSRLRYYDTPLLISKVKQLLQGEDVKIPSYKHKTIGWNWDEENLIAGKVPQRMMSWSRIDENRLIKSSDIILIEGWRATLDSAELRKLADLSIFADADPDLRLIRKICRSPYYRKFDSTQSRYGDKRNFGDSPLNYSDSPREHEQQKAFVESIISGFHYWKVQRDYEKEFIASRKKYADLAFENNKNASENSAKVANLTKLYFQDETKFKKKVAELKEESKNQELIPYSLVKQQLATAKRERERERVYWILGGVIVFFLLLTSLLLLRKKKSKRKSVAQQRK